MLCATKLYVHIMSSIYMYICINVTTCSVSNIHWCMYMRVSRCVCHCACVCVCVCVWCVYVCVCVCVCVWWGGRLHIHVYTCSYNNVAHHPFVVVLEARGLVLHYPLFLLVALPLALQQETATFCYQATLHKYMYYSIDL